VHLRDPEPFGDLRLGHVLEESKQEHDLLALGQRRQYRANRFDIEHLIQIGVEVSETASDRSPVVVASGPGPGRVRRQGGVRAIGNLRLHHLFTVES
jgi:hypothetical protein